MPTANADEYLEINSYPLANPACRLLDLTSMWNVRYKLEVEGAPYTPGWETFPTDLDGLRLVFPGMLWGHVTSDGATIANARAGLKTNYEELYAAVLAPVTTGEGTRECDWYCGDDTVWTGPVQVANFDVRKKSVRAVRFDLTLLFGEGRLTEVEEEP